MNLLFFIFIVAIADVTFAHPLAPALLELTEREPGQVAVRWKTSLWKESGIAAEPLLPPTCAEAEAPQVRIDATSATTTWRVDCGDAGLVGTVVGVRGADGSATDTVLRVRLADGRSLHTILRGEQTT